MLRRSPLAPSRSALAGLFLGGLALAAAPTRAAAFPFFLTQWLNTYPNSASLDNALIGGGSACFLCHQNANGGNPWNAYGWELRQHLQGGASFAQALALSEGVDSDGDPTGSTNLEEILADAQPGWTEGANNTIFDEDGSTLPGQSAPAGIPDLDPSQGIATAYCFGDGAGTPCPCSNPSAAGAGQGCANSSAQGARAEAAGSNSVAADDLVVDAANLLPSQPALLFAGLNALNGGNGVAFGDGLRCAGVNVVRLGIETPDGGGAASWGPGLAALAGWSAGDVRNLQVWYRDPGGPCGSGFNLSNGLEVTLAP